mmetsp:Transcript_24466/g.30473  ORF Transcript_24466/g.30473 Transcript_24466/m.30473 type:complete len:156 (+) Transcript_24466:4031-4498(+)
MMYANAGVSLVLSGLLLCKSMRRKAKGMRECFKMPSDVPTLSIDECAQDVIAECERVARKMRSSADCILILQDLQTFDYIWRNSLDSKTANGEYCGDVYVHDFRTRGIYTTCGVSFSLGHTERFVVLDSARGGADDLFAAVAGLKAPISGHIVID